MTGPDDESSGVDPARQGKIRLEQLMPGGTILETRAGACFVVNQVFPLSYRHGSKTLGELFQVSPASAKEYWHDDRLASLAFRDLLFIDTETTGLSGAGTLAFMVGVGFVEKGAQGEVFVVRQYFLRDHGDETAMLLSLEELLLTKAGLISFNGRSFDIPLLETRYLMNRLPGGISDLPHLDLLMMARRLWRQRLGSVALSNLEERLLGVQRTEQDVPGWLIPNLYHDFVRSGDAREMSRIFYHNQLDILSMVILASTIMELLADSDAIPDPVDLYSLGKWQADLRLTAEAEQNFRRAAAADLPIDVYYVTLRRLGLLLKREGRRIEACVIWQQWAATSIESVEAHVELAKHYEWHERDIGAACRWTEQALVLVKRQSIPRSENLLNELTHRLERLRGKIET